MQVGMLTCMRLGAGGVGKVGFWVQLDRGRMERGRERDFSCWFYKVGADVGAVRCGVVRVRKKWVGPREMRMWKKCMTMVCMVAVAGHVACSRIICKCFDAWSYVSAV